MRSIATFYNKPIMEIENQAKWQKNGFDSADTQKGRQRLLQQEGYRSKNIYKNSEKIE